MTNINPETGKRRYRKKENLTPRERMERDGHNGLWFMRRCETCCKVMDREELFETPWACECLLCTRKRERVKEGLHVVHATPNQQRAVTQKATHAMKKAAAAAAMQSLITWAARRKIELIASGVGECGLYGHLIREAPAVRERLGLPPSPSPYSV